MTKAYLIMILSFSPLHQEQHVIVYPDLLACEHAKGAIKLQANELPVSKQARMIEAPYCTKVKPTWLK